jgi:hypothetical protein
MTEAIKELKAMRQRYKAVGKLIEAKAIERAIARLKELGEGVGFAAGERK